MADNFVGMDEVMRNLTNLGSRTRANARILMDVAGGRTANEAKRVAPWTDRTGHARKSIRHQVSEDKGGITVAVGMGDSADDYPKYLEISNGGKYRVIDPVVFGFGKAQVQDALKDLLTL